jgi:hypothetical protein
MLFLGGQEVRSVLSHRNQDLVQNKWAIRYMKPDVICASKFLDSPVRAAIAERESVSY